MGIDQDLVSSTLLAELRDLSHGRHDIRTECAGTIAGGWFARFARRGGCC